MIRHDKVVLKTDNVQHVDDGVIFKAKCTRVGVFGYHDVNGTVVYEYRPPSEVFKKESLESLKLLPVTDDHPENGVYLDNNSELQKGMTGDSPKVDGDCVVINVKVTDKELLNKIFSGKVEVSMGYEVEMVTEAGVFETTPYDEIQTNIRYNHLAIVDRGRQGSNISLLMDSKDIKKNLSNKKDTLTNKKDKNMNKVSINNVEYDAPPEVVNHIADIKNKIDKAESNVDKIKAKHDSLEVDFKNYKNDYNEESIKIRVDKHLGLLTQVSKHLDSDELKGSDKDIKVRTIQKVDSDFNPENFSDDYINGRFDSALETLDKNNKDSEDKNTNMEIGDKDVKKSDSSTAYDEQNKLIYGGE